MRDTDIAAALGAVSASVVFDNVPGNDDVRLAEFREMALGLMAEHGLQDWTFKLDSARRRAGQCQRSNRVLSFSAPLMSLWPRNRQQDTVLHEIAHALTKGHHGREWQLMCLRIGANPVATWDAEEVEIPASRYTGTCPAGHAIYRDRLSRKPQSCARCSNRFDSRFLFTWTRN